MLKRFNLFNNSAAANCLFRAFANKGSVNEKWDLATAVCLERKPIITPQLNELEKQFQDLIQQIEYEKSLKSDFEIKQEVEVKQLETLKKGSIDSNLDVNLKQTTQDFIDASTEELAKFNFAKLTTEADKSNNIKSLNRKLDKHLVLLMKQKIGDKDYYLLPQGLWQDGETLRQTAERVLKENCGDNIKAKFYGNAPTGLYKYKYPKQVQNEKGIVGTKVYIYFARHSQGQLSDKNIDFKWLDRIELSKTLPQDYYNSVKQFLIDEN